MNCRKAISQGATTINRAYQTKRCFYVPGTSETQRILRGQDRVGVIMITELFCYLFLFVFLFSFLCWQKIGGEGKFAPHCPLLFHRPCISYYRLQTTELNCLHAAAMCTAPSLGFFEVASEFHHTVKP